MGLEDRDWFRNQSARKRRSSYRGYDNGGGRGGGGRRWKWIAAIVILTTALAIGSYWAESEQVYDVPGVNLVAIVDSVKDSWQTAQFSMTPNDEQAELKWIEELYSRGYDWAHVAAYVKEHPTIFGTNYKTTSEQASENASSISMLQEAMLSHRQEAPGCLRTWGVRTAESLIGLTNSTDLATGESSPLWNGSFHPRTAADSLDRCSERVRLRMEDDVLGLFAMKPFRGHLNWYEKKFHELSLKPTAMPDASIQSEPRQRGYEGSNSDNRLMVRTPKQLVSEWKEHRIRFQDTYEPQDIRIAGVVSGIGFENELILRNSVLTNDCCHVVRVYGVPRQVLRELDEWDDFTARVRVLRHDNQYNFRLTYKGE